MTKSTWYVKCWSLCCWWIFFPIQNDAKQLKKWPKPWHIVTHLIVLSKVYPMNTNTTRFRWFSKLASALKGFTHSCLETSNIYVVWTFYTYENNFGINPKLTKYLKESCKLEFDEHFSFQYFFENSFCLRGITKIKALHVWMG